VGHSFVKDARIGHEIAPVAGARHVVLDAPNKPPPKPMGRMSQPHSFARRIVPHAGSPTRRRQRLLRAPPQQIRHFRVVVRNVPKAPLQRRLYSIKRDRSKTHSCVPMSAHVLLCPLFWLVP
jgi:hypothetical protein